MATEKEIDILARTLWGEARGEATPQLNNTACLVNRQEVVYGQ